MNKKAYKKIAVSLTIIMSFVICGFLYVHKSKKDATIYYPNESISDLLISDDFIGETTSSNESRENTIYVYVCGSVNSPGVYILNEGNRVYEAIELAGGGKDAYLDSINLADKLYDGQMIYVPSITEYEKGDVTSLGNQSNALIDINRADVDTLMTLPGIGKARAQAIVDYRKNNGRFETIEDIMKVSGIKESAFNKIKDFIRCGN